MEGLILKYFVLNPSKRDDYGIASRKAMRAYARAIKDTNPALARDLLAWVRTEESIHAGFGRV